MNLSAQSVVRLLKPMEKETEFIALVPVMQSPAEKRSVQMNEYLQRVLAYQFAMSLARSMLDQGIISEGEYSKIDTIMAKKHRISPCTIYHLNQPNSVDN